MNLSFGQLYDGWVAGAAPSATTARMVRTTLGYVASSLAAIDWRQIAAVSLAHALVLLDAATAAANLSSQSRCNYRSYLRRLYRCEFGAGIGTDAGSGALWPPTPTGPVPRRAQVAYERFRRWAIARSVWPATVRAQDLEAWAAHERSTGNAHWRVDYRRLAEVWSAFVASGGLQPLTFPALPAAATTPYAIAPDAWPTRLRDQWAAMCGDATQPLRHGGQRPWREHTLRGYTDRLSRFLGWLVAQHPDVGLERESWATLLSPERCKAHLNWLVRRSGRTTLNPAHTSFLRAVRGFHRFLLGSNPSIVRAFNDLAQRCEVDERDKTLRMVPFELLAAAGERLISAALPPQRSVHRSGSARAMLQVDALIFGLLLGRALRSLNLRGIRIGANLVAVGQGYELRFAGSEMKGHRKFETTVPAELVPVLDDYLRSGFRSLTGRAPVDGDTLLVNRHGRPLSSGWLNGRVRRLTKRLAGKPVHPHFFRHIVATYAAQRGMTPNELAAFLGHRSATTVLQFYQVTNPAMAAARIDALRKPPAA